VRDLVSLSVGFELLFDLTVSSVLLLFAPSILVVVVLLDPALLAPICAYALNSVSNLVLRDNSFSISMWYWSS
jgi:hypothetical protein